MSHLSFSGMSKYEFCPRAYKFHYIDEIKEEKVTSALLFGSAIDAGLNKLVETGYLPRATETFLKAMTNSEWDKATFSKEDYDGNLLKSTWLVEPPKFENNPKYAKLSLSHKGLLMLETYEREILPKLKVYNSQVKVNKDLEGAPLYGMIDLIADYEGKGPIVFDHKTAVRKYQPTAAATSIQLLLYSAAADVDKIGFIVLYKNFGRDKTKAPFEVQIEDVNLTYRKHIVKEFAAIWQDIQNGKFAPNYGACLNCYGGPCPYYDKCHGKKEVL
jgi:hypothetical protein